MREIQAHYEQTPQTPLVHYTSAAGLQGILNSKSLWATHIRFLNDSKEFVHAVELALAHLSTIQQRQSDAGLDALCKALHVRLEGMPGNTWIISFSEARDTLSQWRAYGGEGGYSIEFDAASLSQLASKQHFAFVRCEYDRSRQVDLIRDLIESSINAFPQYRPPPPNEDSDLETRARFFASSWFFPKMLRLGSSMKHPAFSEEQEWRLVGGLYKTNTIASVRAQGPLLVPYVNFELGEANGTIDAVKSIQIGPNSYSQELADMGVYCLLRAAKLTPIRTTRSLTPYRPK